MKQVLCVDAYSYLEKHKVYEVWEEKDEFYYLVGVVGGHLKERFVTLPLPEVLTGKKITVGYALRSVNDTGREDGLYMAPHYNWQDFPHVWPTKDQALTEKKNRLYAGKTKLVRITRVVPS